jgi:hypothetical protein
MKELIKNVLLEVSIDKSNTYEYDGNGDKFMFKDKSGTRNFLQIKDKGDGGIIIKFSAVNNHLDINIGDRTHLKDEKVFNTYLHILIDIVLNSGVDYVEYKPSDKHNRYDKYRARLYKIGLNKYLDKSKWVLNNYGEIWKIERKK